jgi:glutamate formiminotransferase
VVPFVPLGPGGAPGPPVADAVGARDAFAAWASAELGVPCFLYGPLPGGGARTLPEVRRHAFSHLLPDVGGPSPDPRAGAVAVGARGVLVAWNMWLGGGDVAVARDVAAALRSSAVRTLAFDLASGPQVSCNLLTPLEVGPAQVFDEASRLLERAGAGVVRCELVGLVPAAVVEGTPRHRWDELAIAPTRTIEARLGAT